MKYNLKNRPKYGDEGYRHVVYEKWFEGFKKEFQQQLYCQERCSILKLCCQETLIKYFKEILGE